MKDSADVLLAHTLSTPGTFSWMLRIRTVRILGSGFRSSTSGKLTAPTVEPVLMYLRQGSTVAD